MTLPTHADQHQVAGEPGQDAERLELVLVEGLGGLVSRRADAAHLVVDERGKQPGRACLPLPQRRDRLPLPLVHHAARRYLELALLVETDDGASYVEGLRRGMAQPPHRLMAILDDTSVLHRSRSWL